jgi:hypothetical protein
VVATIAIAAALMSDHQSLPLVDEYSIWLIYLRRSVTMPVKNWVKVAVLQPGNDEAFPGILHNLKGTGKMRLKVDWSECKEKRLVVLAFLTCYYSPSSHTLHQLSGIMRFHLHCHDLHCTAIGCWLAVAFRQNIQSC